MIEEYLLWKKQTTKNPNSWINYERWIKRFHLFLGRDNCDFTLDDVLAFRKWLSESTSSREAYSPKNIQYGMTLLRDYISYQMTISGFQFPLKLLKIPQERSNSHYAVTHPEYLKLINLLPLHEPKTLQRRVMLTLLWETGIRVGELLNLKLDDLKERGATIHNEKNHRSRIIGWSAETDKLLKFYLPLRRNLATKEPYLFVSFKWKPTRKMSSRNVQHFIEQLRKEAGLKNPVRPHSFRHGFVHRQLALGRPITTISQMLGHSTVFNILSYAQLSGTEIKEAWGLPT